MSIKTHYGWLTLEDDYNGHETVKLDDNPIAEELEYLSGKACTVRYYISDREADEETLQEDFLINTLYGNLRSEFNARYSEITGYLWTDDELNIGGHDIRDELESYVGKFLYMIIDIDEEAERIKKLNDNKKYYKNYLGILSDQAKKIDKSFEDVVADLKKYF